MGEEDGLGTGMIGEEAYEFRSAVPAVSDDAGARHDCLFDLMNKYTTAAGTIEPGRIDQENDQRGKEVHVSSILDRIDWNAVLVREDLGKAVQQLKREPDKRLSLGGVKLPLALVELGLIDEYEYVAQPRLADHGPTLFAGLSKCIDLRLVSRLEFGSGAVAVRYERGRSPLGLLA